jgi:hypothetical protein
MDRWWEEPRLVDGVAKGKVYIAENGDESNNILKQNTCKTRQNAVAVGSEKG